MMEGQAHYFAFGIGGWLAWLIGAALVIIPYWKLLPRSDMPSWLALLAVVPPIAFILLWVMAFRGPSRETR